MATSRFRRYTSLSILLDILKEKRLTLLDPRNWDDKNDAFYMELYKSKKELKSLLAKNYCLIILKKCNLVM